MARSGIAAYQFPADNTIFSSRSYQGLSEPHLNSTPPTSKASASGARESLALLGSGHEKRSCASRLATRPCRPNTAASAACAHDW